MTSSDRPTLEHLAAAPVDDVDQRALDQLARLYTTLDPVPAGLVERVRFGITLDALHAEIAELQRADGLVGARSDGVVETQTVTFTSPTLTIMVTVTPTSADRVRIDGWAAPGDGVHVELRSVAGVLVRTADADGRFVFDDVSRGLAQFLVRPPEGDPRPPVVTPSIEI
jgi:hypothetical protein